MSERETGEIHKQEEEENLSCFDANWAAAAPPSWTSLLKRQAPRRILLLASTSPFPALFTTNFTIWSSYQEQAR
jgi:hypothetical protein